MNYTSTQAEPSNEDPKIVVNTSIITKRSLLPFIKGCPQTNKEFWPLPHPRRYPYANIYYSFGEDTNPFSRIKEFEKFNSNCSEHSFQPHFPSAEDPFLKRDPYSENGAKIKYLETQPVCFAVFGKPGLESNKLAKIIATSWNCVLISPETQIQEAIEKSSEIGQHVANILKSGENIGQEIIIKLIENRINQRDVKHRGYVLEGLPLIPNDPDLDYSSYPNRTNLSEDSDDYLSSKRYPSNDTLNCTEPEDENYSKILKDSFDNLIKAKPRIRECYECDIPRQIEEMFNCWTLKPQIIIYMVCPEPDLHYRRNQYFWNPHSGEMNDKVNEIIDDSQKNEFDFRKVYENSLKEELINETSRQHLVKRITDTTKNINFQCEIYKRYALPAIDKILLNHNPQNIIRVDGRTSTEEMFQIISVKLRLLPLPRVIVPMKLSESKDWEIDEEEIYGEDFLVNPEQHFEGKTKEEIFEELSFKGTISPRFRWRLSDWKFLCPVELAKGRRVEGTLKNALHFMNCIYFLSSQEAEDSFIENPRPYLLPPNPRSSCKVAIIGPRFSSKSELSNKLAIYLGGEVIDIREAEKKFSEELTQNKIAIFMRENLNNVIRDAREVLQKEREEREEQRVIKLKAWVVKIKEILNRLKMLKDSQPESENHEEIENIRQTLREHDLQFLENDDKLQIISQDEALIEGYAPDYIRIEEQPIPELTEYSPEVLMMLEERGKSLREKPIKLSLEDKVKMISRIIETVPSTFVGEIIRDRGWILDGMYLDPEIWKMLIESGVEINDVIVLFEEAPYENLIKNWNKSHDIEKDCYESNIDFVNLETGLDYFNEEDEDINEQSLDVSSLSEYIKEIKSFEKDLQIFPDKLKELGKEVLLCDLKKDNFFEFVSGYFYKEFQPAANEMSAKEIQMDFSNFENEEDAEEEYMEEEELTDESLTSNEIRISDNRRLGDTNLYCPVALIRNGVFWKGRENLRAIFANKIYLLSNKKALEEFIQNPHEFSLPWKKPLLKIPPVRICIVGVPGSGKSTMSKAISKECGLACVNFFHKIDDFMQQLGFEMISWEEDPLSDINQKNNEMSDEDEDSFEDLETDEANFEEEVSDDLDFENPKDKSQEIFVFDKDATELIARNYRKRGGSLPDVILRESFFKYFKPPFDECGVIFDSFPNCTQDVELMLERYTVPEIIIELQCSLDVAQERLLPVLLESWKVTEDQKKFKEQRRYKKELEMYNEKKESWINDKLEERKKNTENDRFEDNFAGFDDTAIYIPSSPVSKSGIDFVASAKSTLTELQKSSSTSNLSFDPYPEQTATDRIELEQLYLQMNPEPKIFSNWEKENSARKRIIKRIKETYRNYNRNLRRTRDRMKSESIPWIEVDSQIGIVKLFCILLTILDPYLHRNSSVLERTYEINSTIAEKLLDCGYYFLSSFGRFCPVQMYERKVPFHMFLSLESLDQIFPIIHRQYIYFLSGKEALESFRKDPLKYLNQDSSSPLIPVQISIIGPPKCGKSTLAQRIARTYGFKVITRGQSLRHTLEKFPLTNLSIDIENKLRDGNIVTEEQVARATDVSSLDPKSSLGIILDGFPANQLEAEELALLSIKPMIVLDLEATLDFCLECLEPEDIKKPATFSPEFLKHRYQNWQAGEKEFRDWLSRFSGNIVKIDATRCKWGVWTRADEALRSRYTAIKKYFREADCDKVHHLQHLCVSPYEFRNRESHYKTFCPVCVQSEVLKSSSSPLDRKGIFQFRDHFYWICPNHVNTFLKNPTENLRKAMPTEYPEILEETIDIEHFCWAQRLKSGGFCLVTYVENLPYRKIVFGKRDLAILYKNHLYLFCSPECRNIFMEHSSDYSQVEIHFQKTLPPIHVKNLPNLGFLEQTVASLIVKAVNYLGVERPKILGHSASTSAAIYLGAYLKSHNLMSDMNEVTIYKEIIKRMKEKSELLQNVIRNMKKMARRVPVPDARFDYLCEYFKPASKVPAFLNVVDIAGLVKGAAEGQGLGNAFLSHINACDAIFHLCRAFEDDDVTHIEGDVNPVRDLEIISDELRLKDIEFLNVHLEKLEKLVVRGNDKKLKPEYETLLKVKGILVDDKNHIRFADWSANDIEVLNKYLFLTSKPVIYLVNLSEKDYIRKKNKWLIKIKEWVDKNDPGASLIPFSGAFENKVIDMEESEKAKYYEESKVTSALDKIIVQGYKALQLQYFFTSGPDEVKAWTIQKGTKAPQAAGRIHTDFEKGFIMAEVMKFDDFKNEGSESAVKAAGKYRQQGRNYVVEDGDIIFFKFNAGAGLKDPKKK